MNPTQNALQTARDAKQLFDQRFEEKLKSTSFPVEQLTPFWVSNALHALRYASILSLGISPQEWMALLEAFDEQEPAKVEQMNLHQFAIVSNNLQARTPDDLGMRLLEYGDLMEEADRLVVIWQELSNKLRDEVEQEVTAELQMKEAANKGLKAVKSDA